MVIALLAVFGRCISVVVTHVASLIHTNVSLLSFPYYYWYI